MSRNMVIRLKNIPLISTVPRSYPSLNFISVSATRPDIVVRLDDDISTIAFDSAIVLPSFVFP